MAYTILQVPGDGEVISSGFLTRIRDNQEFLKNVPGVGAEFQRFTSSGTWTKPADVTWVYVMVIGGGGGGQWSSSSGDSRATGGGGGSIAQHLVRASTLGSSVSITVGSGGAGAVGSGTGPTNGGNSSFGSYAAPGGRGLAVTLGGDVVRALLLVSQPGQGGAAKANSYEGVPGLGQSTYTTEGNDGADSQTGTGAGGGGAAATSVAAGDGGAPGGGGGGSRQGIANAEAGDGARGEVRVYAW